MIAATVPAQPINIITTFTGTNVIVSWTLVDDGGAPITAYTVLIRQYDELTYSQDLVNCNGISNLIISSR